MFPSAPDGPLTHRPCRRLPPEVLQPVELARLRREDVDHAVEVVEQDPAGLPLVLRAARERIAVKVAGLRGAERIRYFDMPRVDVSSTMVRRRAAAGEPIRYLVPDAVAAAIAERGLYRSEVAA